MGVSRGRGPSGVNVYHKPTKLPDMYTVVGIQYTVAKQHVFPTWEKQYYR